MKLPIKEFGNVAINNKKYLNEFLVRFQYTQNKKPIKMYSMILKGDDDTPKLFPDAPNREAVTYNFEHSIKGFKKAFTENQNAQFVKQGIVKDFKDLLKINIDHTYNPIYIYTNGQKIVTMVKRGKLFEIALHKDYHKFFGFFSEYNRDISLEIYRLKRFNSLVAAETEIRILLSKLDFSTLVAFQGKSEKNILMQNCGYRSGEQGYSIWTHLIHFNGKTFPIEIQHAGWSKKEPYRILNEMSSNLEGYKVKSCATCKHFMFSGMSRDMGGGASGYCNKRMEKSPKTKDREKIRKAFDLNNVHVSVFNLCDDYSFILDKDRKISYLAENQKKNKNIKNPLVRHVKGLC